MRAHRPLKRSGIGQSEDWERSDLGCPVGNERITGNFVCGRVGGHG